MGAILSSSYTGTVRLEPVTPLESALGPVDMFKNISNELSSSADTAKQIRIPCSAINVRKLGKVFALLGEMK